MGHSKSRRIGTSLWLAIIVIACVTLLGFGAEWSWIFFYADQPRMHYAVMAGVISSCAIVSRRCRLALVGGLVFATNVAVILPALSPGTDASLESISVLHANLGRCETVDSGIERALADRRPSFLLFQEVTSSFLEEAEPKLRDYKLLVAEPRSDTRGVAAFVRKDWKGHVSSRIVRLAPKLTDRPTIELVVDSKMRLLSFHSKRPSDVVSYSVQAAEYRDLAQWFAEESHPSVAIGDFNAAPWSRRVRSLLATSTSVRLGGQVAATWPSGIGIAGIPLDIVVHTDGVMMTSSTTLYLQNSDHKAIIAEFCSNR